MCHLYPLNWGAKILIKPERPAVSLQTMAEQIQPLKRQQDWV